MCAIKQQEQLMNFQNHHQQQITHTIASLIAGFSNLGLLTQFALHAIKQQEQTTNFLNHHQQQNTHAILTLIAGF